MAIKCKIAVFHQAKGEKVNKILFGFFLIIFALNVFMVISEVFRFPVGSWDALYIWNFRTKFFFKLYESGVDWKEFFSPVIAWSHMDYPLLLPLYNYKNQLLSGTYSYMLNTNTSVLIYYAVVAGVIGIIREMTNRNNALWAGIFFLSSVFFIENGMSQRADIPLSLFILAAFIMIIFYQKYSNSKFIFGAYFFASTAAFCKNEGILFFIIFSVLSLLLIKGQDKKMIFCGAFLPLLCTILLKLLLFSQNDLFENRQISDVVSKISDISRYKLIFSYIFKNIIDNINCYVLLFIFAAFTGFSKIEKNIKLLFLITFICAFISYFAIYLITPRDLSWHLETSMFRLISQYIPLFVVCTFTVFNCFNVGEDL